MSARRFGSRPKRHTARCSLVLAPARRGAPQRRGTVFPLFGLPPGKVLRRQFAQTSHTAKEDLGLRQLSEVVGTWEDLVEGAARRCAPFHRPTPTTQT